MSLNVNYHYERHESVLDDWTKGKIVSDVLNGVYNGIIEISFDTKEDVVNFLKSEDVWFDEHGNMTSYNGKRLD